MAAHDPRKDQNSPSERASLPEVELGDDGVVDLGELDFSSEGSSIPMAELPPPPSGQSLTSWTEVIRRQRAAQGAVKVAEAVEVDAPSDRDLLAQFKDNVDLVESPSDAKRSGDTSEIPQAEIPVFTSTPPSESEIDLGDSPASQGAAGSEVRFDVLFPPSDAGGAMPIPGKPLSGSYPRPKLAQATEDDEEIPFGLTAGAGMSGVDLGAATGAHEPGRSSILDVLLQGTGPSNDSEEVQDFGEPPITPIRSPKNTKGPANRPQPVATQPGIDLSESQGASPSDVDLELSRPGSDDAVDIYAQGGSPPSLSDSGTLEISEEAIEESQRNADLQNSSSVDMSSRPSFASSEFDVGIESHGNSWHSPESDIDLDLPPIEDEGNSSAILPREELESTQAAIAAEFKARRQRSRDEDSGRNEIVPSRSDEPERKRRGYLLHGGVLGLLLGAGSVLAAYFGGALPDRKTEATPPVTDSSGQLAQLRDESFASQKLAADSKMSLEALRKSLADVGVDADKPAATIASLKQANSDEVKKRGDEVTAAKPILVAAQKAEKEAKAAADLATKGLAEAEKAATDAKKLQADANKAEETAKAETVLAKKAEDAAKAEVIATKKAAADGLAAVTKSLASAGLDPAKLEEGLKKLADARSVAEAKEKEATAKLVEATKKETDLIKIVEAAKKQADDASKARETSELTLKGIVVRLAKAKFVGDKPDSAAVFKGIDEAIKSATSDTTVALREELVKVRAAEAKSKADLAIAKEKEVEAAKIAVASQAEAKKLQDTLKIQEAKAALDATKFKTDLEKFAKEATESRVKAEAAVAEAIAAKANSDRLTTEATRMKTLNDRLSQELAAVRELAELIKAPNSTGSTAKLDPVKLGERFFSDGMRLYFAGRHEEAESAFRKAIQFKPDDARYHYLHGLSLWMNENTKGAELAFEKGRDLERDARPPSRAVSAILERVQGPARQAVNIYRP